MARAGHKEGEDKGRTDHPHTCSGILKREYTPDGHLARTIDETGRVTTYTEYDGAGRPGTLAQSPRTAEQRITHIDYQPLTGRPVRN